LGDANYRPTARPAHVNVSIEIKDGAAQTIDFPPIPDQAFISGVPIALSATASSHLPVQYIVVSGPVELDSTGTKLKMLPLPPRTKFPVLVRITAFQWGRPVSPKVQTAPQVVREFEIRAADAH
jgi:hypothetical protein